VDTLDSYKSLLSLNKREEPEKIEDIGNNGTARTFVLTLKSYIGSGLLSMPFAFLQGSAATARSHRSAKALR
jgi:hypothetical protein